MNQRGERLPLHPRRAALGERLDLIQSCHGDIAVKGGEQKLNPLTKTMYTTKSKPAYNRVNIRPVKSLKEALK